MNCIWTHFVRPFGRKKPSVNKSPQNEISTTRRKKTTRTTNARDSIPQQHESLNTSTDTNNATISSDSYKSTLPFLVGVPDGEDEISLLTFNGSLCSKETKESFDGQAWLKQNISWDDWEMSQLSYGSDSDTKYTRVSI
jgi:hypothetical protein